MRSDIVPGVVFPDYELSDHRGTHRPLSALQHGDPHSGRGLHWHPENGSLAPLGSIDPSHAGTSVSTSSTRAVPQRCLSSLSDTSIVMGL